MKKQAFLKQLPTFGFLIWLLLAGNSYPYSFFSLTHVESLLLAAPLFLLALAWQLEQLDSIYRYSLFLSAILLSMAFLLPKGYVAALFSLPCFLLYMLLTLQQWRKALKTPTWSLHKACRLAAFTYLPVGGAWAIADRLGWQPMDFSSTITLLTAVHFHYAGFLAPILASWLCRYFPHSWNKIMASCVIAGIPLVAIGITTSQLGLPSWIELCAAMVMATAGFLLGLAHIIAAWHYRKQWFAFAWALGGFALLLGMSLAFLYGIRFIYPISFITIPWMYAVHGTLNAVGFALPTLVGWLYFFSKKEPINLC